MKNKKQSCLTEVLVEIGEALLYLIEICRVDLQLLNLSRKGLPLFFLNLQVFVFQLNFSLLGYLDYFVKEIVDLCKNFALGFIYLSQLLLYFRLIMGHFVIKLLP